MVTKTVEPVRGMEKGKLLSLCSRVKGHFFRAHFAHLSKVVVLVAKTVAPVRGIEKGRLLSLCSTEIGHFFWARFAHLSKVVVLVAKTVAPVRGIEKGKLLLLCSRERERGEGTFSGLALLASQKWWFCLQKYLHQ